MILSLHILVAVLGLASATFGLARPSTSNIRMSWALVAMTIISGILVAIDKPSAITHLCVTGLIYVTIASSGIVWAQKKLSLDTTTSNE